MVWLRALLSRLVVVSLAVLVASVFPSYDSSNVPRWAAKGPVDLYVQKLACLSNWDGVHFLHIAESSYLHEHSFAFFPGKQFLFWSSLTDFLSSFCRIPSVDSARS
jgi:hypothetical protein